MSIEGLGALGEIVGALAVLASLVYLAKQIKHSSEVAKVTSYHEGIAQIVQAGLDSDFTRLINKTSRGEDMSEEESLRGGALASAFIFGHEILFHLYKKGQVDEALWDNIIINNLQWFGNDMIRPVLEARAGKLTKELRAYIKEVDGNATIGSHSSLLATD